MRSITYDTDHETIVVSFNGPLTTVEIYDDAGIRACGHAKQHPDDNFSDEFGKALALSRASHRYFRKIEKRLVRSTK